MVMGDPDQTRLGSRTANGRLTGGNAGFTLLNLFPKFSAVASAPTKCGTAPPPIALEVPAKAPRPPIRLRNAPTAIATGA
jgi:hypothetical protein